MGERTRVLQGLLALFSIRYAVNALPLARHLTVDRHDVKKIVRLKTHPHPMSEGPVRVISGHRKAHPGCLLYRQKQTCSSSASISAKCQIGRFVLGVFRKSARVIPPPYSFTHCEAG